MGNRKKPKTENDKRTATNQYKCVPLGVCEQFRKDEEMTAVAQFEKQRRLESKFRSDPLWSRPQWNSSSDGEEAPGGDWCWCEGCDGRIGLSFPRKLFPVAET